MNLIGLLIFFIILQFLLFLQNIIIIQNSLNFKTNYIKIIKKNGGNETRSIILRRIRGA